MKKIKVSEAQGAALDWLVAKCEGVKVAISGCGRLWVDRGRRETWGGQVSYTNWSQGGPIIEREGICFDKPEMSSQWICDKRMGSGRICRQYGSTILIAALRCYVASKLGEEVEVPDELS